jgi:hypothetical protein
LICINCRRPAAPRLDRGEIFRKSEMICPSG